MERCVAVKFDLCMERNDGCNAKATPLDTNKAKNRKGFLPFFLRFFFWFFFFGFLVLGKYK